ncbi:SURF1 family cytochrome oxidase biogenesis protein [uncultured Rothia sp.]|uniref:SURF1 family protein n=1 Tax=uncultured Rothia sp. TaxID=316088 RepID=UPI003217A64D
MFKLAFTPRWIAGFLLVLAVSLGFVMLSKWQLNASTLGQITADPAKEVVKPWNEVLLEHEPLTTDEADSMVKATGTYVSGSSYLVADKLNDGAEGYWVVSELIPDNAAAVDIDGKTEHRGIVVARAWTAEPEIPSEPTGEVTVAGRVVANDQPFYTSDLSDEEKSHGKILGTAAAAQLTNIWDSPLYSAIITADAEVPASQALPLTAENTLEESATIMGQSDQLKPIKAHQVTDDEIDWLNIFYALEWVVFAGFALYLWWRMLRDSYHAQQDPALYFEYEGEYWLDEESGRYYYWDPADQQYYFFDEVSRS